MRIAGYEVTIGADPEVFIVDTVKNSFVSAHDIIPGTKKKPYDLDVSRRLSRQKGLACQADGTALEINIPPADSVLSFLYSIGVALGETAVAYLKKDQRLCATPVARYSKDYFGTLPATALELGCDPDYDAWNGGKANPRPTSLTYPYARTGAGHIAVGWRPADNMVEDVFESNHFNDCIMMVQMMDLIYDEIRSWHEVPDDEYRRGLYGKRGAFRPKPFGVEYRTPSNSWLRSHHSAMNMYNMAVLSFALLHEGYDPEDPATKMRIQSLVKNILRGTAPQVGGIFVSFDKSSRLTRSIIGYTAYNFNAKYNNHDFVAAPPVVK